jgi:NAD-specific glutamate dehydrogenase
MGIVLGMADKTTPDEEARRLSEEAENRTAKAMEQLVARDSFGELLARMTENVLAVVKIGNDAAELVVRNLRLAGRRDITGLARQLARTEDKLELVLQEVERLEALLEERGSGNGAGPAQAAAGNRRARSTT